MELTKRKPHTNTEFVCELTEDLDGITLLDHDDKIYDFFRHYLMIDEYTINHIKDGIPIRVPGSTVGGVWIDDDNKITKIVLGCGKIMRYPDDIDDKMKKYIGVKIEHENL